MSTQINIKNKKAKFEYEFLEKFTAGLQLFGTEIKSIRAGKASIIEGSQKNEYRINDQPKLRSQDAIYDYYLKKLEN